MIKKIKVAIIGQGEESIAAYRVAREVDQIQLVGVVDYDGLLSDVIRKEGDTVLIIKDFRPLIQDGSLDVILFAGEDLELLSQVKRLKNPSTTIMEARVGTFLNSLLQTNRELLEVRKLEGELSAILNSVQEAIEVADNTGLIKYVNPAFTRVTGIPEEMRVGQNIFEVSPHGALAQCLMRQQKVVGHRTQVGGSSADVISNAAPILVDGEMEGAVVVFQPITDILKLMEELQKSTTIIENLYARMDMITGSRHTFSDLAGNSKAFQAAVELAQKAARSETPLLINGESGTGKNVFAHAIHQYGNRRTRPFIKIKCGDIPEELMEGEFFGYEKGAYSGAQRMKLGRVDLVRGGTLFIDEVATLKPYFQEKLLSFIKSGSFKRVGGQEPVVCEARVIVSSSTNLKEMARKGRFSEEIYFLLSLQEITLPSLKQRKEDITLLVQHFINHYNRKLYKQVEKVSPEAMQLLTNYDWPGNIREMSNIMERAMVEVEGKTLGRENLALYINQFSAMDTGHYIEVMPLDKMEQMMLKAALSRYGKSLEGKKKAAQALNISLATLYNKLKKFKANF